MERIIIGIPVYRRDDYPTIRVMMDDAETLPANFDEWEKSVDLQTRLFERTGAQVFHIAIHPREFSDWCKLENLRPGALARTRFATLSAHRDAAAQEPPL